MRQRPDDFRQNRLVLDPEVIPVLHADRERAELEIRVFWAALLLAAPKEDLDFPFASTSALPLLPTTCSNPLRMIVISGIRLSAWGSREA
jgi:hypothetical protein